MNLVSPPSNYLHFDEKKNVKLCVHSHFILTSFSKFSKFVKLKLIFIAEFPELFSREDVYCIVVHFTSC